MSTLFEVFGGRTHWAVVVWALLLLLGTRYSGAAMPFAAENGAAGECVSSNRPSMTPDRRAVPGTGEKLYLKNCALCHGADGHGDEGPDLHKMDWSDDQIAKRIRNGKKGEMTAFAGKFSEEEIYGVIGYLRTLK